MGRFIKEEFIEKTQEEIEQEKELERQKQEKIINTLEQRKERRIIILFLILIACIPFVFPILNVYIRKEPLDNYLSVLRNSRNVKTIDGYMLIGNVQSSSELSKISFYNVKLNSESKISFTYEALSKITDIKGLNLYVEIYNKDKNIIYRERFNPVNELEKNKIKRYARGLNSYVYSNAFYLKINKISDVSGNDENIKCVYKNTNGNYTLDYEIIYTFNNDFLIKYEVNKSITGSINNNNANVINLKKEYETVKDETDASYSNNTLNYTVDLSNDYNNFKPINKYGNVKDQVYKNTHLGNWSCE